MFDLTQILTTVSMAVGSGIGVWFITEGVKKVPQIPINSGNATALRATAGSLSALAAVMVSYSNGSLQTVEVQDALQGAIACALAWVTAHATHKVVK